MTFTCSLNCVVANYEVEIKQLTVIDIHSDKGNGPSVVQTKLTSPNQQYGSSSGEKFNILVTISHSYHII